MNTRKLISTLLFTLAFSNLRASDPVLDLVALQQKTLAESGIGGFYKAAKAERWSPPLVKSKWAINRITDENEKARLNAQFELGRRLLLALPDLGKRNDNVNELQAIERFVIFADWMASKRCYGNALIARRSFDLALPRAGNLITDPASTTETLKSVQQLLNPTWANTAFASAVLDNDASVNLFSTAAKADNLQLIWASGVRKAMESKYPNWSKSVPDGMLPVAAPITANISKEMLPLFLDDPMPPVPTTEALLQGKHHEIIVVAIEPANASRLRNLLVFRQALKSFPDESMKSDFYPGLKGAFDESWRKYYQANSPKGVSIKLGLAAWSTYDAIKQSQFITEDEANAPGVVSP
jgi:hypothetical protein